MKIAIISDTHDNMANLGKAIGWFHREGITLVLHCGDICTQRTMDWATAQFQGEMKFVKGNGDYSLDVPEKLEASVAGKRIGAVHFPDAARKMAESGKYDVVFHGHTHMPWEEKIGDCRVVNPGELAGQRFKPSFAVYDPKKGFLSLKILEKI